MRLYDLIVHAKRTARAKGQRHVTRKPTRPLPPLALEVAYMGAIQKRNEELRKTLVRIVEPRVLQLVTSAGIRTDDWTDDLDAAMNLAKATFNGIHPEEEVAQLAQDYAFQVSAYQKKQLTNSLVKAVGVNVFFDDRGLLKKYNAFVKQNVDLITSIDQDYLDDVKTRLMSGIRAGTRVESLRATIEDRYEVSRGRASVIARDQVGKLYGELNRERQKSIGIDQYVWRGVEDQRERATHLSLEGNVYTWGDPPVTNDQGDRNEPGQDYCCRCTAEPVLPDVSL